MPPTRLARALLDWYGANARDLPWRRRVNPYGTWVSEVMLQQTRVEVVVPYYRRWMRRFPSMRSLAASSERDVLTIWEGLGYYSRALNLRRAAQVVMREHGGRLPSDPIALRQLSGIGEYTAAAIASIAFDMDVPALDGNVLRVLARLACIRSPGASSAGRARIRAVAQEHLPHGRAGEFNQALMDLGALICVPHKPRCGSCPLEAMCEARRRGLELLIPRRTQVRRAPHYVDRAAVLVRARSVLLVRRRAAGLLGGLWEFPKAGRGHRLPTHRRLLRALNSRAQLLDSSGSAPGTPLGAIDHAYSHFSITVHAFKFQAAPARKTRGEQWVPVARLSEYPMGKIDREIATRLQQHMATTSSSPEKTVRSRR